MIVESEKDFMNLRMYISTWYVKFPLFKHDILEIEQIIEERIKQYSIAMVYYRQSHKQNYLDQANEQIGHMNRIISIADKMVLMALLSKA